MPRVEFLNAGKTVECGQYANLRKLALFNNVPVYAGVNEKLNCQGNGVCGTCVMQIVEGQDQLSAPTRRERLKLSGKLPERRLSCQCQVMGDLCVVTAPALD